jgi:hypothetical protein
MGGYGSFASAFGMTKNSSPEAAASSVPSTVISPTQDLAVSEYRYEFQSVTFRSQCLFGLA